MRPYKAFKGLEGPSKGPNILKLDSQHRPKSDSISPYSEAGAQPS